MARTPPELKWLSERRARVAHKLLKATERAQHAAMAVDELKLDLEALDRAIKLRDASIDPTRIDAINGWKGRYGARGSLSEAIVDAVMGAAPSWIASTDIEACIRARLGIRFETSAERQRWYGGTFKRALRTLATKGIIERLPLSSPGDARLAHWCIARQRQSTLAELRAANAK